MKRKWMALFLALVMCVSLVACGDDTQGDDNEPQNQEEEQEPENGEGQDGEVEPYEPTYGEVEIDFWQHMDGEQFQILVDEYMDLHPNVKINLLSVSFWDYGNKIIPALAGGTAPDILLYDLATATERLAYGQTVDLTDHLAARGFDPSQFRTASMECCMLDDQIAGLPYLTDVRILYYNKDHFAEAGIEEPPATWDQVLEYTEKLTTYDENGNIERMGFHTGLGNLYPWTMIWTYGGQELDGETPVFNSQEGIDALQMAYDIQEASGGYDNYQLYYEGTQASTMSPFVMGDVSMIVDTNEFAATIMRDNPELNWGAAILPTSDGENNHWTWSGGFDLEFTDHGDEDRLNAAIDFGLWLVSKEAQITYGTKSANLMCNTEAAEAVAAERTDLGDEYWAAVMESYDYGRYHDRCLAYPDFTNTISAAYTYVMDGTKTPKQALDDAAEIVTQEINNYHLMND